MAGGGKRRRGPADGGPSRPSPHRPSDTNLGQHDRVMEPGFGRTTRNSSGGGGGAGRNMRRNDRRDSFPAHPSLSLGAQSSMPPPSPGFANMPPRPSSSSSAPQQQASASAPAPAPAPVLSARPPSSSQPGPASPVQPSFFFTIVTDDLVARWSKGGRQELVAHGSQSCQDEDPTELIAIFQELLHSVIDSRLPGSDAGRVIKEMLGPESPDMDTPDRDFDPHTLFLDTLATSMDVESSPFLPQLRDMVIATDISPALFRQVLDPPILQSLNLVRETFVRLGIRQSTNLLYRQANYNLLREETEGYSKLVTDLFTTSNNDPPSAETVQSVFNKVMSLIGTFDLDPGRVLDVTLDVFAAILIKQFRFFIKFLRISSWWPRNHQAKDSTLFVGGLPIWALPEHDHWQASEEEEASVAAKRLRRDLAFWDRARQVHLDAFFELGGRRVASAGALYLANSTATEPAATSGLSVEKDWIKLTKTMPPSGNHDAAQMLGFKLRFYASEARDPEDVLPANLLYLAALLIKVGFISLVDLWNHVWPLDEEMEKVKETKMREIEEKERANRPGGAVNALMMAGALLDDMAPPPHVPPSRRDAATTSKTDSDAKSSAEATPAKPKLPDADDQKVNLLRCLLTIGALPESLFIIGRHDWILQTHPDILPLLHRVVHQSLTLVFAWSQPTPSSPSAAECPSKPIPDPDQSGVPKGRVKLTSPTVRRALKWPYPDKIDTPEGGGGYRFYWDEWADNIPICQTVDDVFTLCNTFVNIIGVNIGQDASLVAKLASIGAKSLADDASPENKARWQDLLRRLLLPSVSLLSPNSSVIQAVWNLVKQYPLQTRYNMYAEWYEGQISRLESMKKAFARTRLETLSTMKRLSLTNLSQMAKQLAKTATPSPGIVCKVALMQIESYPNLIEAFVECSKYFTELGYDVLVWSVLSSLGDQQRSRTQADSVLLTSKWLQALSRFSGKVFQRFANMEPAPILRYVNSQLSRGNSTDLVILKELISSMGGVVSDIDFTDAQLKAMTGGELLRQETLLNLGDRRAIQVRSAERLMKALVHTKLAGQLLINLAQYRQSAFFKVGDSDAVIKFLATTVDDAHQVFVQYLDLLRSSLSPEVFNTLVPDVIQMMRDLGLDAGLAFMIARASLRSDTKSGKSPAKDDADPTQAAKGSVDTEGDVLMVENGVASGDEVSLAGNGAKKGDGESAESQVRENHTAKVMNGRKAETFLDSLPPVAEQILSVRPRHVWASLSPEFYVIFWSLQLGDLAYPMDSYQAENSRLKKLAEDVMKDRTDMSRLGMNKKAQKRSDILDRQQRLTQENQRELSRYTKTKSQLIRQITAWFPGPMTRANATSDAILAECILPRLQLSLLDAEYCFKLIKFLHEAQAPNFQLMSLYNRLFQHNRLRSIIYLCTLREAEHLGRFMKCVLGDLAKWHGDKSAFEKEALGSQGKKTRQYLGFATKFDGDGKPSAFLDHEEFKVLLWGWHKELNTAVRSCLADLEWMHVRNAITLLKSVMDHFPVIVFQGKNFLKQLETITEREGAGASKQAADSTQAHRVDLSVAGQTAYSELAKRQKNWIILQEFRDGSKAGETEEEPAPPGLATSTVQPKASVSKVGKPKAPAVEEEDGEVKDGRVGKAPVPVVKPAAASTRAPVSTPVKAPVFPRDAAKDTSNLRRPNSAAVAATSAPTPPAAPAPQVVSRGPAPRPIPSIVSGPPPTVSLSSSRPEPPRQPTLPAGPHGLPSRPPDAVAFPRSLHSNQGQVLRDGRRDLAAPNRDPRDPREGRELRDPRDTTGGPVRGGQESINGGDVSRRDGRDVHVAVQEVRSNERMPDPKLDRRQPEAGRPSADRPPPPPERLVVNRPAERPSERLSERPSDKVDYPSRQDPLPRRGEDQLPRRGDPGPPPERDGRRAPPQGPSRADPRALREAPPLAAPAPPPAQKEPQGPPINPDRAKMLVNPERAALIEPMREIPSRAPPRDPGRELRERPSKVDSPRRSEPSGPGMLPPDSGRDDRGSGGSRHRSDYNHSSGRDLRGDHHSESHARPDRNPPREPDRLPDRVPDRMPDRMMPPERMAERQERLPERIPERIPERMSERMPERAERMPERMPERIPERAAERAEKPPGRGSDYRGIQQDPNYGRLNPIQSIADLDKAVAPSAHLSGPPSGPRGRGRNNAARIPSSSGALMPMQQQQQQPEPKVDGRFPAGGPNRLPSPERHPPTGPASSRTRRATLESAAKINTAPAGSPTGPSSTISPVVPPGIHPSRLSQFVPPTGPSANRAQMATPNRPSSVAAPAPQAITRPSPSVVQTTNTPGGAGMGEMITPTGPSASSGDRIRNGGGSRQLRGIQDTLEKASADAAGGRGGGSSMRLQTRPSRSNLAQSDAQILTGSSPINTPNHERHDPFRGAVSGSGSGIGMGMGMGMGMGPGLMERSGSRMSSSQEQAIQVVGDSRDQDGGRVRMSSGSHAVNNPSNDYPPHTSGPPGGGGGGGNSRSSSDHHERSSRREHHRSDRSSRPRRSSRERSPTRSGGGERGSSDRGEPREPRESSRRGGPSGGGGGATSGSGGDSGGNGSGGGGGATNDIMAPPSRRTNSHRDSLPMPSPRESLSGGGGGGDRHERRSTRSGGGGGGHRSDGGGHRSDGNGGGGGSGSNINGLPPPGMPPSGMGGSGSRSGSLRGGGDDYSGGRGSRESRSSRPSGGGEGGGEGGSGGGGGSGRKRRSESGANSSMGGGGGGGGSGGGRSDHRDKRPRNR